MPPTFLKMHRRRSALNQDEMRFLLRSINNSCVGRVENGQHTAKIELLLAYHLLFDTSIESMFELWHPHIQNALLHNVRILLTGLKEKKKPDQMRPFKIRFLEKVVERLKD